MIEFERNAVQPIACNEEGWQLIKSDYWLFFAMTIVLIVIVLAVSLVLNFVAGIITAALAAVIGNLSSDAGTVTKTSMSLAPQFVSQVTGLITNIIAVTLSGMLSCGLYRALSRQAQGQNPSFENLFEGFEFFQPCLIISLITNLANFVLMISLLSIGLAFGLTTLGAGILGENGKFDPNIFGAIFGVLAILFLVYLVVYGIIAACTIFVYPLISLRNLSAVEALGLSLKAGFANFFGILGLLIVQSLMSLVGILLCGVGLLFVVPILSAGMFSAYQRVFGQTSFNSRSQPVAPPMPPIFNNKFNY